MARPFTVIHPITRLVLGGAQQNTMETCAGLDRRRFAAEIVSGPETGTEGEIITEVRRRGIPLTILPELVRRPSPVRDFQALTALTRLFRRTRPHIVHTHSSKAGMLGRWAARRAGVPVIVHTVHGWGHNDRQPALLRRFYIRLERMTARITDKLIVVSERNAEKGLGDGIGEPERYVTVHSSIRIDDFMHADGDTAALKAELGLDPQRPVVGTVARLSRQKNPADFIRLAANVRDMLPGVQFLFVGDGPLRAETEERIEAMGLAGSVVLAGLRTDIPAVLQCLDVFVLTSLWEGLPRVIPQAMAAGVPVVANCVDGVAEVIRNGENGFTVAPGATSAMAGLVVRLLRDAGLRSRLQEQGRATALAGFSLDAMIGRIEAVYTELLTAAGITTA